MSGYFGSTEYPRGTFGIIRETLPSLRATAYKEFIELLHLANFYTKVEHRKTSLEIQYGARVVSFFSSDDLNSAKIRGRQNLAFYINEANSVSFSVFYQLIIRTEAFCILDYNPAGVENWCKEYIEGERFARGDVKLHVSTYKMNPYIPAEMVEEIEGLKHTDIDLYNCYALGQWIESRNNVFQGFTLVDKLPEVYDFEGVGVDFGWFDPTTAVRVRIIGNELYIDELFYASNMTHEQISDALYYNNVDKAYCDNASPRMINNLKRLGNRVRPAKKGQDSIIEGIRYIQRYKIFITKTSLNAIKEFRLYRWQLNKETLKPIDKPIDKFSHIPDATRYALSYAQRSKLKINI
jgi:phage terminase large subunit